MYRGHQEEFGIDLTDIYLHFSKKEDVVIRQTVASSIHEAFKIFDNDLDTSNS